MIAVWVALGALTVLSGIAAVQTGDKAPGFTLTDQAGNPRTLAEFKGKTVVLEWNNPECPFVRKHYESGSMQALQKEATDQGVIWLSIVSSVPGKQGYLDPSHAATVFKEKGYRSTALLLDSSGQVGRTYGARTTPHLFIIDASGTLVYHGAIDSIKSADPADIPRATNYVRQGLADLAAGKPLRVSSSEPYGCGVKY